VPEVRRIRPGERAAALSTILAAFRDDPQVRWWFPGDSYREFAARYFGVLLDTRMEGGEAWVADEGRAVSLWVPPGGNLIGPEVAASRYRAVVTALPQDCGQRIRRTDEGVDGMLPPDPHWYLGVLACHPNHRGAGLGWAVAAPVLAAADRAGLPVALETANPANVGYYTRRGFAVAGRVTVAGSDRYADAAGRGVVGAVDAADGVAGATRGAGAGVSRVLSSGDGLTVHVMVRQPRG
jgi:ribosomal protein S18 acetylase RimI-like enzyme